MTEATEERPRQAAAEPALQACGGLCCKPDVGVSQIRTTTVLSSCFCVGQAGMFALQGGIVGEARIVERAFGLGPCALTEAMAWLQDRLANAES